MGGVFIFIPVWQIIVGLVGAFLIMTVYAAGKQIGKNEMAQQYRERLDYYQDMIQYYSELVDEIIELAKDEKGN